MTEPALPPLNRPVFIGVERILGNDHNVGLVTRREAAKPVVGILDESLLVRIVRDTLDHLVQIPVGLCGVADKKIASIDSVQIRRDDHVNLGIHALNKRLQLGVHIRDERVALGKEEPLGLRILVKGLLE